MSSYKSIHSEISRIADEREALVSVHIRNWMKKAEPADRFCAQKVNVIVLIRSRGCRPILELLKKPKLIQIIAVDSSSILSRMLALSHNATKQESWLRKSWWNALQMLGSFSWSIKISADTPGFRDLRIPSKGTWVLWDHLRTRKPKGQTEIAMPAVLDLCSQGECRPLVAADDLYRSFSDQGARNHPSHCDLWVDSSPDKKALLHSTEMMS